MTKKKKKNSIWTEESFIYTNEKTIYDATESDKRDSFEAGSVDTEEPISVDSVDPDKEALRALIAESKADALSIAAEYKNYRLRANRDKEASASKARFDILKAFLPVMDNIAGAREANDIPEGPMEAILAKLEETLSKVGMIAISEDNVPFDPQLHSAAASFPVEGVAPDHVSKVIRLGYRSEDGLIRAAEVLVTPPAE